MSPDQARSAYLRALGGVGETVTIRRYAGTGTGRAVSEEATAAARVSGYAPYELVGAIRQGDRKLIILVEDLENTDLTLPVRQTDKVVIRDLECSIEAVDDNSRRLAGELIAYELQVRG